MRIDLFNAIARDEIAIHLQPLVALRTGRVAGFEALARWTHPSGAVVAPSDFIPLATQWSLITPLTLVVLRKTAAALRRLRAAYPDIGITVNLALETLRWPGFERAVREALEAEECPLSALAFEITEGALMTDPEGVRATMRPLHEEGVKIYLDDFGVGYSSLGRLAELELDAVKIDRKFVGGILVDRKRQAIVRAMIGLAHDFGFEALGEGVEDSATLELLAVMGCDTAQGYHLALPMPESDVDGWMANRAPSIAVRARAGGTLTAHPREPREARRRRNIQLHLHDRPA